MRWFWPNRPSENIDFNYQPDYNIQGQWWGTCPHCNGLYQLGNKFCPNCGKPLDIEIKPTLDTVIEKLDEIIRILSETTKTKVEE